MTHLPLTLCDYTTASGPVTITRIGKHGKWAFDAYGNRWRVATGVHSLHPVWAITGRVERASDAERVYAEAVKSFRAFGDAVSLVASGRVEPAPADMMVNRDQAQQMGKLLDQLATPRLFTRSAPEKPLECWMTPGGQLGYDKPQPGMVRMIEAAPIEAELIAARAQLDEAVKLLLI